MNAGIYKPKSSNHNTPLKINMEHNKRGLEDAFPFPNRWLSGGVTSPSQLRWLVKLPNCCAGFDDSLSNHHWHLHHFHFSLDIMAGHLGLVLAFDKLSKVSWLKRDLELNFYSFPSCSFATVDISSQKFKAKPKGIGSVSLWKKGCIWPIWQRACICKQSPSTYLAFEREVRLMGKGHQTFPPGLNWDKIEAAGAYIIYHNMLV